LTTITTIEELEDLYGTPAETSLVKVTDRLTPGYRRLVEASPFMLLATAGPEGLDCSPRGDRGQAVTIRDDRTVILADRRGNNRIDSLRNIVRDPRVALIFLIPGSTTTLRINGTAVISVDPDLLASLAIEGTPPRSALVISIGEVYFQCSRALMRASLWEEAARVDAKDLPTVGELLKEIKAGFDAATYDREWPERAVKSLW
jgi:PPOX class probable FMN-dependent enzyme, DR_2398 family